jgi:AP-2 complex subunit alpha
VLKIAILAEKFADDSQWYVDVVIQLVTNAGDFVTEDIWYRII